MTGRRAHVRFFEQRWYIEAFPPRCLSASAKSTESRRADSNRLPLLTTSDASGVAGVCTALDNPLDIGAFLALGCPVLHCIAFPLVSEWCQTMSGILALALQRFLAPLLVSPPKQVHHSIGRPLRVALWSALGLHRRDTEGGEEPREHHYVLEP
jgi:hypothetical protein